MPPPPPSSTGPVAHHNPRRRQYPTAQLAGYESPAPPAVPVAQPAVDYAAQPQGQMFTPGLAAQGLTGAGQQGYFAPGQTQPQPQGFVGYGQPQQAQVGGVQGLTDGMRGMGIGEKVSFVWR